ncbi:MAG TPA: helix-turn-helix domain-containing protein [Streptosporangiaceae bacterium]|nr:helix-turn-helix domain-containing protein [Streptosporangiaceae bacterium]
MAPGERQPEQSGRTVKKLTDPRALRALAHPLRLRLLGQLRIHGQLTATRAGELVGESSASCSFHLRQLAKYGLVEESGGGRGRERPWRATTMFTSWPEVADDPNVDAAAELLRGVIIEHYVADLAHWFEARPHEPETWQQAAQFGDTLLYVTAGELTELGERVRELVDAYLARQTDPALRPPGARLVSYLHIAHPVVDRSHSADGESG